MKKVSESFLNFLSPQTDRKKFIQDYLMEYGIEAPVISISGKNHIYVKFPLYQYEPMFNIKTVIAHYDRAPNSMGANDNSMVVYCMLEWATRLFKMQTFHNIRLIFTDGEELSEKGVSSQGSYDLALLFKKLNIVNDDIFIFDSMGRGTIPVISENKFPTNVATDFINKYKKIENKAIRTLQSAGDGKYFILPTGYSDNASFLANGISSCAITMLPSDEIDFYLKYLNKCRKSYSELKNDEDAQIYIPKTWKMFHTNEDNVENLNEESFIKTTMILNELNKII